MAFVPSLESKLYLTDPQSIIAYQFRKFMRTPLAAVPIVYDNIISLPWLAANFWREPDLLATKIQSSLQNCYNRIFNGERTVTVSCSFTQTPAKDLVSYTVSIMYTTVTGELDQIGGIISLGGNGQLIIPEDNLTGKFSGIL